MSAKTRRERRKAEAQIPVDTDWLWACPSGMPLREIACKLNFTVEPQTELSSREWADDLIFRDDIYRALNVESCPCAKSVRVAWDGLDDHLCNACSDGHLIVIRDLPPELPKVIQMLISIIGWRHREHGFHFFHSRDGARFALVLERWDSPTIHVRHHKAIYTVSRVAGNRAGPPAPARRELPPAPDPRSASAMALRGIANTDKPIDDAQLLDENRTERYLPPTHTS